ncbi:MAG: helicase-related protein [Myxococcota bacterium]
MRYPPAAMWQTGSKLVHPFNPELGIGVVRAVEGRYLKVYFPEAERELTLAAEGSGLEPLVLEPGARARLLSSGEKVEVAEAHPAGYRLRDGRVVEDADLWPLDRSDSPIDRIAALDIDPAEAFLNRLEGLELQALREAGGLGSFLGGRIELFPHQLHTALIAVARDPVRWLLADEVGLGKTIEACLISSALLRTDRARGALILAPATLTVQWLGELYRKFHQVFVLLDSERIESVERDYGTGVNPFEVHPFAVLALEPLATDRSLLARALEAPPDLLVVDEAHRLARGRVEAVLGDLVRRARHALLLTATPLQADRRGFFDLLNLLHPEPHASFEAFERSIERGEAAVSCTSAVRRADLDGLPRRVPRAVDLSAAGVPEHPAARDALARDPRARWIAARVRHWLEAREKVLVFVGAHETLEALQRFLESTTRTRIRVFHEDLSPAGRDIEVASFRDTRAPVLLCTDAAAEGRNFQFCDRMIHYDLPYDPVLLEQRIGRLDRIGRQGDVEILYFREPGGRPDVAGLYERLDLFARSSAGLDDVLSGVRPALEAAASGDGELDIERIAREVARARTRRIRDVPRGLYRDAYDPSQDVDILARVPPDLEVRMRRFCLEAAAQLGLKIVEKGEEAVYYLELGDRATVEGLPGVPDGSRYLGSFSREEAVRRDEIDFFASGHPLVEGLLLELEDGPRGRAAAVALEGTRLEGHALLCLYRDAAAWFPILVNDAGELTPEQIQNCLHALRRARPLTPESLRDLPDWPGLVRKLAEMATASAARRVGPTLAARPLAAAVLRLS